MISAIHFYDLDLSINLCGSYLRKPTVHVELQRLAVERFPSDACLLVSSGAVIMALTFGLRQSFGLYLPPISMELEAARETFALGMGLMNLVWGLSPQ